MVKVSVIVPCFNVEKYISKCLDSLVNQTLEDIEIILVDDGSKDKTKEIISYYAEKYPDKIHFFPNRHQGISKTRNFGIKQARGKYISFIDSDDYIDVDTYKIAYSEINRLKADIIVWDYCMVFENGRTKSLSIPDFKPSSIEENPEIILNVSPSPCNKLFKKELFEKEKFEDIKYEDLLLITKILMKAKKIAKLNKCLYYYRVHSNSETTVVDKRIFDILKIVDKLNKYFMKVGFDDQEVIEYYNVKLLTMYNIQQRCQKDKKIAKEFIDQSFAYLDDNFPNWRHNRFFNCDNRLKVMIKKSKVFTKIYTSTYRLFRRKK